MNNLLFITTAILLLSGCNKPEPYKVYLDELDLSEMEQGWEMPKANLNVMGKPIQMGGIAYEHGVGSHATSVFKINSKGTVEKFVFTYGYDDKVKDLIGDHVRYEIWADGEKIWTSAVLKQGDAPLRDSVMLKNKQLLELKIIGVTGEYHTHVNWADAYFAGTGEKPEAYKRLPEEKVILTPPISEAPMLNYPRVFGVRPGSPVIFRVPVSGLRPMTFKAINLPKGLVLDNEKGVVTGKFLSKGEYQLTFEATNAQGSMQGEILFVVGNKIALTPPLGWNSWNAWGLGVDQQKVADAGNVFLQTGMADMGWSYINIDDGWEAPERDAKGNIQTNEKFPNLKTLSDQLHAEGLKLGIYSSPGVVTCGNFLGSLNHEAQDAATFAAWGIDFLKYDQCSYKKEMPQNPTRADYQKPYLLMGNILANQPRDMVYSLCQYGLANVWEWGDSVNGNMWRTTGDIIDTWTSMSEKGFGASDLHRWVKPGNWNDPDMLVVGHLGWGKNVKETRLSPSEQYTHITLWTMAAAPMLLGCDVTKLDSFTINLLTNREVLAIHQDYPARAGQRVMERFDHTGNYEVWLRELSDGSKALAIFNRHYGPLKTKIEWKELGIKGTGTCRNVWTQTDLGKLPALEADIKPHGVWLLKITE